MAFNLRQGLGLTCCYALLFFSPLACSTSAPQPAAEPVASAQKIRVRLVVAADNVTVMAGVPPLYQLSTARSAQLLNSPRNAVFTLSLKNGAWQAGNADLGGATPAGPATLYVHPDRDGSISINGTPYHGRFRFVPVGNNKFDVINDVDLDAYLAAVVAKEMLANWHDEAFRAQAVIARTYALYEKQTAGLGRHWDVWADTRSQVYGGIPGESAKSRLAVADTAGVVVAAPDSLGNPRIFKAYFSSCCGGITQSAADAFGDPYLPALSDQDALAACRASPRFNWGGFEVTKEILTKRFRDFGDRRKRGEKDMETIARVDVQATNPSGRPIRFVVTDVRGEKYSLSGEEFRWAVNTGAPDGAQLLSSFVKVISDSDRIRFVEGHGWGHGVGLCQWCAEKRATDGLRHEDILLAAYPTAVLVRAY
jgi:stage II sporulation protein D